MGDHEAGTKSFTSEPEREVASEMVEVGYQAIIRDYTF
jgi:hypothetical protein